MVIRQAREADLDAVEAIYDQLHTLEEKKVIRTGWIRHVYPTRDTAMAAMVLGTLYVLEDEGVVRASAKIDQEQPESYSRANWTLPADVEAVLVLHTLEYLIGVYALKEDPAKKAGESRLRRTVYDSAAV